MIGLPLHEEVKHTKDHWLQHSTSVSSLILDFDVLTIWNLFKWGVLLYVLQITTIMVFVLSQSERQYLKRLLVGTKERGWKHFKNERVTIFQTIFGIPVYSIFLIECLFCSFSAQIANG